MKKILLIAAVALLFGSLASCKKDYVCTCTGTEMGTLAIPLSGYTSKDAKTACDDTETTYKTGDATANCELD